MTYTEILQSAGYPTDCLTIDFETYFDSEYHMGKDKIALKTIEYIMDERFEVLGLGMKANDNDGVFHANLPNGWPWPDNFNDKTFIIQNAKFDITILKEKFGIVPKYIIDLKDLACHYDSRMSHSLKDLAKMFGLPAKGDTNKFKGLHVSDMTPELWKALAEYCNHDCWLQWELFKKLMPYLTNYQQELALMRHTLDLYLNPRIKFDFKSAASLKEEMETKIVVTEFKVGHMREELSGNKSFVALLEAALPEGEHVPMKKGKKGMIPAFAKTDDGMEKLLIHLDDNVSDLAKARQAIKSWPLHAKRITRMENQARVSGDLLRIPLHYYGGHTGRWSGGEGINPQNFGGKGRVGGGIDPLIGKVRELLRAPDSYTFVIDDSSQIEARILAWLAGQSDLLGEFARGEDIYSIFASRLFGCEVRKPRDGDSPEDSKRFSIQRGFGKDAILGCGYGMGGNTFYIRCLANPDLKPLFQSGQYDYYFIKNLVSMYRTTYACIPDLWGLLERCFRWVTKHRGEVVSMGQENSDMYRHLEKASDSIKNAALTFWNDSGTTCIQLPSGRVLYYRHASVNSKNEIRYYHGKLWGGTLVENVVQAIARDLLAYWILEFESNNLPVVLHTHDEIVSVVPIEQGEESLKLADKIMCTSPEWGSDLPLAAEGMVSGVYKK